MKFNQSKLIELLGIVLGFIDLYMVLIFKLQFIITLSPLLVVYDIIIFINVLFLPFLLPERFCHLRIFQENEYRLLANIIIMMLSILVFYEYWNEMKNLIFHNY